MLVLFSTFSVSKCFSLYLTWPKVCFMSHFFCSYHILTSSVINYWTDPRPIRIYLSSYMGITSLILCNLLAFYTYMRAFLINK